VPTIVKVASNDGTTIASWRSGTGPTVVLIHGMTVDHTAWDGMLAQLGRSFTLYAMDRRGRGASGDGAFFALDREVEDVVAVVDGVAGPVCVVGHSYGALCALEAARLRNVASLVLYDPPVISLGEDELPRGLLEELDGLLARERRDDVVERVYQALLGLGREELEQLRADPLWTLRVALAHTIPRELRIGLEYRALFAQPSGTTPGI
jgi:pimeloyl-ACP methyl ester carboxylesterase